MELELALEAKAVLKNIMQPKRSPKQACYRTYFGFVSGLSFYEFRVEDCSELSCEDLWSLGRCFWLFVLPVLVTAVFLFSIFGPWYVSSGLGGIILLYLVTEAVSARHATPTHTFSPIMKPYVPGRRRPLRRQRNVSRRSTGPLKSSA